MLNNEELVYSTDDNIDDNTDNDNVEISCQGSTVTLTIDELKRVRRALTFTIGEFCGGKEEASLCWINEQLRMLTGERF